MKTCPACKIPKALSEFRTNKSKRDGLQGYCKECDKEKQSQWYQNNRQSCIDKAEQRSREARIKCRKIVMTHLRANPCVKCKESDPVVLEFDHIRGVKLATISELVRAGRSTALIEEIKKCQILCANCHKRKTAKDFGWYKLD